MVSKKTDGRDVPSIIKSKTSIAKLHNERYLSKPKLKEDNHGKLQRNKTSQT